jgi:predicted ArsR family transcriptional regulator
MTNWLERLVGNTQARMVVLLRRSHQTISGLAQSLGLTDNAVRTHVAALGRDGIVESVGQTRVDIGKPARIYGLTRDGEELFPKAYALVLGELVDEVSRSDGPDRALALLRAVGARAAKSARPAATDDERVEAAADVLRGLGGDLDVSRSDGGWRLQGYGCPLSAVTATHPQVCELARTIVQDVTGRAVRECCDRGDRPRCSFQVA